MNLLFCARWVCLMMAGGLSLPALADAVRLNGIWQPGCRVVVSDGVELCYIDPQGRERRRPLSEIQGLQLDAYPDYHDAVALIAQGQDLLAVRLLRRTEKAARGRDAWLAADAAQRLAALLDRAGEGLAAAGVYLEAAARRPAAAFLDPPPLRSVAALPEAQRAALRPRIERVVRETTDPASAALLGRLLQAVRTGVAPVQAASSVPRAPATRATAPARAPEGSAYGPGTGGLLPAWLPRSAAADRLVAGEPAAAAIAAAAALRLRVSDEALFLRGVARLRAAPRGSGAMGYKDAALDLLRVVILFPNSRYAGPALVEAARAMRALDQPAAAATLLEEARGRLDPEDAPRYHSLRARLAAEP